MTLVSRLNNLTCELVFGLRGCMTLILRPVNLSKITLRHKKLSSFSISDERNTTLLPIFREGKSMPSSNEELFSQEIRENRKRCYSVNGAHWLSGLINLKFSPAITYLEVLKLH